MRHKLRIILVITLLAMVVQSFTGLAYAHVYQQVNVLIAYDEEWSSRAFWGYGYCPETLARIIFYSGVSAFWYLASIDFTITDIVFWDSDDYPANDDVMMDEMIAEVGFTRGMSWEGTTVHVLVGFTDQELPNCYGYCDKNLGVVLCEEVSAGLEDSQRTDNILQHELSHLYNVCDHYEDNYDCVMNCYPYPIEIWWWVPWAFTTNHWCNECSEQITANAMLWGYARTDGWRGGGGAGLRCAW